MEFVGSGNLGVFVFVGKTLFLDSSHVDHVRRVNGAQQVLGLGDVGAVGVQISDDVLRHLEQFWTGKDQFTPKPGKCMAQRVDGAAVAKVASKDDFQTIQTAVSLANGEEVEHGLCWMMACTIATIENWDTGSILCILCSPLAWVPHGDDVGVSVDHLDGVKEGFAFHDRGGFHITEVHNIAAKALHGGFKRHACSCAWFKEQVAQDFSLQQGEVVVAFGHGKQAFCIVEDA